MAEGDRLDRIERILENVTRNIDNATQNIDNAARSLDKRLEDVGRRQDEMAARQQYHDEAFERNDAEITRILEAIAMDAENIRALVRVAELPHHRQENLEGGEAA